ncbi:DUF1778 domain-containing protein [Actinomadura sp. HBU206391]|nr:DUF1778 domain-containing protein [Actinomadura sp. HBU206391]MBC6460195.1 DUF1778 domain-containing protein [Actinomadura sp. HBU206391]
MRAALTQLNVSAFVLSAATAAASNVLADRRAFILDEQAWAAFDAASK